MYGIDVDGPVMADRSWRWLRSRVMSLLDRPPRFIAYQSGEQTKLAAIPSTRLGYALTPPKFGEE